VLLHRLEEGGLGPWGGAIDLVDQQDVREDRPARESERPAFEQARACDVDGQEVRCALDPVRIERQGPGDRAGEEGLAGPGDVLDEDVTVGEQGGDDQAEGRIGTDDRPPDGAPEVIPEATSGMLPAPLGSTGRWGSRRRDLGIGVRGGLLGAVGALDRDTRGARRSFSLPVVARG
jgi:hypothetical protein